MDRRAFGTGLVAAGASCAFRPNPAFANERDKEVRALADEFTRVHLTVPGLRQAIVLTALLVVAGNIAYSYNMQQKWQRFGLSRANLGALPLLGSLTRQTVQTRIANMHPIGQAYLVQATLVLLLSAALPRAPKTMTVVNDDNEFWTKSKPDRVRWNRNANAFDRALTSANVGAHFDPKTGELLALIPPHLRLH
ncbi:hypothetical protein OEW28_05900 [Defluviimonas sp. WL0002]|uniref:Uncharacterized protein n=1 Tax=Albidovulum marisflavi TaxID=2984159 RepID=A0ABT2ZAR2_9RHOB|nr:hypothetical protein [Defluviimonas sp. WL0002]MCV2868157.1 hypothetical protein [Defluviimonas sp. WL0002]